MWLEMQGAAAIELGYGTLGNEQRLLFGITQMSQSDQVWTCSAPTPVERRNLLPEPQLSSFPCLLLCGLVALCHVMRR